MDWKQFLATLAAAIVSIATPGYFLLKKWLSTKVEQSVKHEYDKKLEEHKAALQKQLAQSIHEMNSRLDTELSEKAADREFFMRLLNDLPSEGCIKFVKTHDMGGSFERNRLDPLHRFCHTWKNPEHEFLDAELEHKRQALIESIAAYLGLIGHYTFTLDARPQLSSVPKDWQHKKPNTYNRAIKELHSAADRVVKAHEDLVRTGRRELKSLPPSPSSAVESSRDSAYSN